MVTPLLYYHPASAYGTREDSVQLFSSSLQCEAYAHIKTCNHDKDTQLPRALAILSCSFWRSSLRKGGGQTGSCSSCSADMISTTIRILWASPSTDSQWEVCMQEKPLHGKIACYSRHPFACRKDTADEL